MTYDRANPASISALAAPQSRPPNKKKLLILTSLTKVHPCRSQIATLPSNQWTTSNSSQTSKLHLLTLSRLRWYLVGSNEEGSLKK